MAKYDQQLGDLRNHLANAKSVLIALPQNITVDKKIGWVEAKMLRWQVEKYSKHLCNMIK